MLLHEDILLCIITAAGLRTAIDDNGHVVTDCNGAYMINHVDLTFDNDVDIEIQIGSIKCDGSMIIISDSVASPLYSYTTTVYVAGPSTVRFVVDLTSPNSIERIYNILASLVNLSNRELPKELKLYYKKDLIHKHAKRHLKI